jgi:hypothetical protein
VNPYWASRSRVRPHALSPLLATWHFFLSLAAGAVFFSSALHGAAFFFLRWLHDPVLRGIFSPSLLHEHGIFPHRARCMAVGERLGTRERAGRLRSFRRYSRILEQVSREQTLSKLCPGAKTSKYCTRLHNVFLYETTLNARTSFILLPEEYCVSHY